MGLTYFNLFLFGNWLPILCCNSRFPINTNCHAFISLMIPIHPETCQVVTILSCCKSKLTICLIFMVMKVVSIWRCYLHWYAKAYITKIVPTPGYERNIHIIIKKVNLICPIARVVLFKKFPHWISKASHGQNVYADVILNWEMCILAY